MNKTMDRQEDRLLRAAMERRAARVPALSDDFQERVMAKMRKTHPVPPLKGGGRLRRWWLMVPAIGAAAAVVVGLFMGLNRPKDGSKGLDEHDRPSTNVVAVVGEARGGETETSAAKPPTTLTPAVEAPVSAPSLQGRAGGGSSKRAVEESVPAASVSDLYATIDAMTDQALREAERQMIETLSRNVAADTPS